MNKIISLIQNTLLIVTRNLGRACLTSLGIIISMTIYVVGMTMSDSYVDGEKSYYSNMKDNELISDELTPGLTKNIKNRYVNDSSINCYEYLIDKKSITNISGASTFVETTFIGVSSGYENMPFRSVDVHDALEHTTIQSGRAINNSDILAKNRVINIYEAYAKILFGTSKVLGKVLRLDGENYVIVGTLKDSPDVIRSLRRNSNDGKDLSILLYAPNSLLDSNKCKSYLILKANQMSLVEEANALFDSYRIHFISRSARMEQITNVTSSINTTMDSLLFVLVIFSSVVILIVMLFNVKERFYEIGIRRAIGASKDEIRFSVLIEAFLYSISGIIIGAILGILVGFFMQIIVSLTSGFLIYSIHITSLLYPIAIILISTTLFSLIPACVAANMNISTCLKVE